MDGHGVEVAGQHDPLGVPEVGAGDHGVPVTDDRQVREAGQRLLDRVRDLPLGAAD